MAENTPIRLGIIGLGRAGWDMQCKELKGRERKFRIVAACDTIDERREKMAERYGCRVYDRPAGLIADPEVELVSVATRSNDHYAHTVRALKAGKHVLVEKPMCLTHREAVKLKALSDVSPGRLFVRHNRRFEPGFMHIREIIASGILGDIFEIKLRRNSYSRRDDWQTLKVYGGGQLLNWGPHIIDHALRFLETPPVEVWSDLKKITAAGDAEDHLKIALKNEQGLLVDLEISGGNAVKEPEYIVCGSRGGLVCDGNAITLRYLDRRAKLRPRVPIEETPGTGFGTPEKLKWVEKEVSIKPRPGGMAAIWDHLYADLRRDRPFPVSLDEAVSVMEVISRVKKKTPFA